MAGLAGEAAASTIADRFIGAAAAEQFAERGVSKPAIVALYEGASRMNCIALGARLYRLEPAPSEGKDPALASVQEEFASFLMVLVMREIQYRTYAGLAQELESFSGLVDVFNSSVSTVLEPLEGKDADAATISVTAKSRNVLVEDKDLQKFFLVLKGCLATPPANGGSIAPDTKT